MKEIFFKNDNSQKTTQNKSKINKKEKRNQFSIKIRKKHSPRYQIPVFSTCAQSSHLSSGYVRGYLGFFDTATGMRQSFG
jgi:hypothetical protein